ncbi:Fumarylpyruvate hydrolase [compost metagenome]
MGQMIANVYCVGRNYALHAQELGNDVPQEPMIFLKPSHAITTMNGNTIQLPSGVGEVHYEAELVLKIARPYEKGIAVDELVDVMALGIDFTLRDVQTELKKKGHPWMKAKGFLHAAPLSRYVAFDGVKETMQQDFMLQKNGAIVQQGNISNMIFSLQEIVDYIGTHYGLGVGDHIFTGTPAGVGPVVHDDHMELFYGAERLGECHITFEHSS